ncbi:glycosyltransferase family 1 protein [Microbulbifer sp. NBRC 101763]|uniref:glycosyltransferase family 1 protein n=1 Tax=Microbulbifer sp. NBRC 101763 TaxID=1113820 RepID=UPI00334247E6
MRTELDNANRWLIVEEGPNPSTDYFVIPYLRKKKAQVQRLSFSEVLSGDELEGLGLIFVRYIPRSWQSLIHKNLSKLSEIYLFIDDDLFDWSAFVGLPLRYQLKIFRYSWSRQGWLKSIGAGLLVSTPYLQSKYQEWSPQLLQAQQIDCSGGQPLTVFYHGSASHIEEIRWLVPIIQKVLQRNSSLNFEVIGDGRVNNLFRGMSRVKVIHPMKWSTYLSMLQKPGRTIGLAPLLDTPFNKARSYTKFFDITRAGAVGIYANGDIYGRVIRHQENGLLVPMETSAWVDGILHLADDKQLREKLLSEARQCL